jgi:hypothetical protein
VAGVVYRRIVELMESDLGNELVTLDPEAGKCFGFNEVATWVWRRLAEPASFEQLRDELLGQYDVAPEQCTRELRDLIDQMLTMRLIAPTS